MYFYFPSAARVAFLGLSVGKGMKKKDVRRPHSPYVLIRYPIGLPVETGKGYELE